MALENSLELDVIREQIKQYCAFSLGERMIANTKVSYDPLVIRLENARIREALACVIHYDTIPFGGISDISSLLLEAKKGRVLTEQELLSEMREQGRPLTKEEFRKKYFEYYDDVKVDGGGIRKKDW